MRKIVLFLFFLAAGCAPHSKEDFQHEGESLCRDLTKELRKVQTREDLAKAAPKIKAKFEKIVDLVIEAKKFQMESEEEETNSDFTPDIAASDAFLAELKRVYKIEAGRDTIEKAQKEALLRLDAFDRSLKKLK